MFKIMLHVGQDVPPSVLCHLPSLNKHLPLYTSFSTFTLVRYPLKSAHLVVHSFVAIQICYRNHFLTVSFLLYMLIDS